MLKILTQGLKYVKEIVICILIISICVMLFRMYGETTKYKKLLSGAIEDSRNAENTIRKLEDTVSRARKEITTISTELEAERIISNQLRKEIGNQTRTIEELKSGNNIIRESISGITENNNDITTKIREIIKYIDS